MRRFLSILFIAVASVCFISVAILPHHHHGDKLCVSFYDCQKEACPEGDDDNSCTHSDKHRTCLLTVKNCLAQVKLFKSVSQCAHQFLFDCITEVCAADVVATAEAYISSPYIFSIQPWVCCTSGLRAPPKPLFPISLNA